MNNYADITKKSVTESTKTRLRKGKGIESIPKKLQVNVSFMSFTSTVIGLLLCFLILYLLAVLDVN